MGRGLGGLLAGDGLCMLKLLFHNWNPGLAGLGTDFMPREEPAGGSLSAGF